MNSLFIYEGQFATSGADGAFYLFDADAYDDCGEPFDAYWYSKAFDFGAAQSGKRAGRFTMTVQSGGGARYSACFRDDIGEQSFMVTAGANTETLAFYPAARSSSHLSVGIWRAGRLSAPLTLTGFSIEADVLG